MRKRGKGLSIIISILMIITMLPAYSFATDSQTMKVDIDSVSGMPGAIVKVNVNISNNTGLSSFKSKLSFDESIISLQSIDYNTVFGGQSVKPEDYSSPVALQWLNPFEQSSENGVFATLTFKIADDADENKVSDILMTYDENDIYNLDEENINISVNNGSVAVLSCIPGDINGDKVLNNKDATRLFQYLAGWKVTVNEPTLDVNGDSSINNKDATRLFQYLANWNVKIFCKCVVSEKCVHSMDNIPAKESTCKVDGNVEYWHCTKCGKYFGDLSGSKEITLESTVLKASHNYVNGKCTVCGDCGDGAYTISYDISNGDEYLEELEIADPERSSFTENDEFDLETLKVPGYIFKGWYDENDNKITKISKGTTKDINLYAKWNKIEYTVQFTASMINNDTTEMEKIKSFTYTVDKGATLQPLKMDTYNFIGWSDTNGHFYKGNVIPKGTTGNLILKDNWVSQRNMAKAKTKLDDPLVIEDSGNQQIFFCYEIGTIENVPLYTTQQLNCVNGIITIQSKTDSHNISEEEMEEWAKSVSKETTRSTQFTLSKEISEATEVSEKYIKENGYDKTKTEEEARSQTNTTSLSTETGGSSQNYVYNDSTTKNSTNQNYVVNKNFDTGVSHDLTTSFKNTLELSAGVSFPINILSANVGVKNTTEVGVKNNTKDYMNYSCGSTSSWNKDTYNENHQGNSSTNTKNWNTTSFSSLVNTIDQKKALSETIHEMISSEYGYGKTYSETITNSESLGVAHANEEKEESSTTVAFTKQTIKSETVGYQTTGNTFGNYRLVMAGTMHVFAVVGYDVASQDYFVYTYNVLGDGSQSDGSQSDGWHEIIDYSYDRTFNDLENSVIPFEVPNYVIDYVDSRIAKTEGLEYNFNNKNHTAIVEDYKGKDKIVYVPSYMVDKEGNAHKVTGITSSAFKGKDIKAISLGRYVTQIPDNAFKDCTSLEYVICPAVTKIGKESFSGCASMKEYKISKYVTEVGTNAFYDVPEIIAEIGYNEDKPNESKDIAENLSSSGAKSIYIDISAIPTDYELAIEVDKNTNDFVLNGKEKEFSRISVDSHSKNTSIKNIGFVNCSKMPLKLYSDSISLYRVGIEDCSSYAMLIGNDNVKLNLSGTNTIKSLRDNAIICKNTEVFYSNSGKLGVSGNVLVCGEISGNNERISFIDGRGEIKTISEDEFEMYEKGVVNISLDASGGTLTENQIQGYIGTAIGAIPTPTREYYTFDGWYTEASGGKKVNEGDTITWTEDITLYARWTINSFSVKWNNGNGYSVVVNRTSSPNAGASKGVLSNGDSIYYGDILEVQYKANEGYSITSNGSKSINVNGNVTSDLIYCTATPNNYTYSVVYKSSNGTYLGGTSVTKAFGTTNNVSPASFTGYNMPASQSIKWDSTSSKTITFTYYPSYVNSTQGLTSGTWCSWTTPAGYTHGISHNSYIEIGNRTDSAVDIRVIWTNTVFTPTYMYYNYPQYFYASINGYGPGVNTTIAESYTFSSKTYNGASSSGIQGWLSIPVSATSTSVAVGMSWYDTDGVKGSWYGNVPIPAY